MGQKVLAFKKQPELKELAGLTVNGAEFVEGRGYIIEEGIVMDIPGVFRFQTKLEVAEDIAGIWTLIMTQFLMRGPDYWEMGEAFERIGFKNPEIEMQLRVLCDELIARGLAEWKEIE